MQILCLQLKGTPFPLADANGNCVTYSDNAGNVQAHYTYDAFGNTISSVGDMDDYFRFRFSSKYLDDETGLYNYGFRYYAPAIGRWVNRDPIEEAGGVMLYGFVKNDIIRLVDVVGLREINVHECQAILHLGHTSAKDPITWNFPESKCAFGGVVGCRSSKNNPNDPKRRWPNVPHNEAVMFSGLLEELFGGRKKEEDLAEDINIEEWNVYKEEKETVFAKGVENALSDRSLRKLVRGLWECCEEITVEVHVSSGGWEVEGGIKEYGLKPEEVFVWHGVCPKKK